MSATTAFESFFDLTGRYLRVFKAAWSARESLGSAARTPLERQFLPAALEIVETPTPALPRAILWTIIAAAAVALIWSIAGKIDLIAVASGKVIAADKTKVIQPAETAVVKKILVADGQQVKAGDVLIELEAAATATAAETARTRDAYFAALLEAARYDALAHGAQGVLSQLQFRVPASSAVTAIPKSMVDAETRAMQSLYQEHRAKLAALDAEIAKHVREQQSARDLVTKLTQTLPIAQRRANDYKNLMAQKFIAEHAYLEKEQARIEMERDLDYQKSKVLELDATVDEAKTRRRSLVAEFERVSVGAKVDADKKAAQAEQELVKARTREMQQVLRAPVDGTVQQLAVHTVGGVVTPAQALLVITPSDYQAEVEATLENKDVGFVKVGQHAEIKVETFPFTRYGTLGGTVTYVSSDAVPDEKKGLLFQARVKLDRAKLNVDGRDVTLTPGMAVSAEIATGNQRAIEFFLDPIRKTVSEGLRER